jgi:hypothetical protein
MSCCELQYWDKEITWTSILFHSTWKLQMGACLLELLPQYALTAIVSKKCILHTVPPVWSEERFARLIVDIFQEHILCAARPPHFFGFRTSLALTLIHCRRLYLGGKFPCLRQRPPDRGLHGPILCGQAREQFGPTEPEPKVYLQIRWLIDRSIDWLTGCVTDW